MPSTSERSASGVVISTTLRSASASLTMRGAIVASKLLAALSFSFNAFLS
ncbi:Uncharacterised protein [Mycobacteroides abscessus subsp. abscessus]|nr:Uncharacterised protein [Mycobacteroides abscessus subsp. abscessus]